MYDMPSKVPEQFRFKFMAFLKPKLSERFNFLSTEMGLLAL